MTDAVKARRQGGQVVSESAARLPRGTRSVKG